ncbi:MAG: NAD-dependent epimerase/dehydratase family protein [Anaerolineae bacterium]|nr:NAD-dependent epimerase/dehydratase family protein [Anaerolineae bacterium]
MKRVLLTGGSGFVGANLARRLLQEGHQVHLLLRPGYADWRLTEIQDALQMHVLDLHDPNAVTAVVRQVQPEWIFHLAAHGAYSWQRDLHAMIQTNFLATVHLVNACLETGFEAFVHTGSSSEYGVKDHAPSERTWLEPNSHYAVTKAAATLFCRFTAQQVRVHLVTLRLYSVFGPYEAPGRLMPTLIWYGLRGQLPPLVDPTIARDYVYVDDVNEAFLLAASRLEQELGAVYNVGTGVQTSLREVVTAAQQMMDIPAEPQWGSMPNRAWDATTWVADSSAIRTALGWQPRYTLPQGLQHMVTWMMERPNLQALYAPQPT